MDTKVMSFPKTLLFLSLASMMVSAGAIAQAPITYQGQLVESGVPFSGTVNMEFAVFRTAKGGIAELIVPQADVIVADGLFQVELELEGLDLSQTWYLEARVNRTVLVPRQRVTATPFALYALASSGASSFEGYIVVAKGGGDFDSVADALNSIADNSPAKPYLVWVAPGVYFEDELVEVPAHVHLKGSGPETTIITSDRSNTVSDKLAATVHLHDLARLSNLSVENTGPGPLSYAIDSFLASRDTVIDNVVATASGAGSGGARSGIHLRSAAPTIKNSFFKASGATGFGTGVNAGLSAVHTQGGAFPQPLILGSTFLGGPSATVQNCTDNTGTGIGMQLSQSVPDIRNSHICGGHRGMVLLQNGQPRIQNSELRVGGNFGSFLFEITASGFIRVSGSGLGFVTNDNKLTGAGTGLACVANYNWGNLQPLSNGTTAATACNL